MAKNTKEFIISTADFVFYHDDKIACTGTTNINASLNVTMDSTDIQAGKYNNVVYSYKYNRKLEATLEAANWDLAYLACQTGSDIEVALKDVYKIAEPVKLVNGVGTLTNTAVDGTKIGVEFPDGRFVSIDSTETTIDLADFGLNKEVVRVTYQYNTISKGITIFSGTSPLIGELVLSADKHDTNKGKIADLQIIIPSFQLDGNFEIALSAEGSTSTNMSGMALAFNDEESLEDDYYAIIREIPLSGKLNLPYVEIVATSPLDKIKIGETTTVQVYGLRGGIYKTALLENSDCTFTSSLPDKATVGANTGLITGVAEGDAVITIEYKEGEIELEDTVNVTIIAAD